MIEFAVKLKIVPDGVGYLVTSNDMPEMSSNGDNIDEAIANGLAAASAIFAARMKHSLAVINNHNDNKRLKADK